MATACAEYRADSGKERGGHSLGNYGDRMTRDSRIAEERAYSERGDLEQSVPWANPMYDHSTRTKSIQPHSGQSGSVRADKTTSTAVSKLAGIDVAHVIVMDGDAFASVTLEAGSLGTKGRGGRASREQIGITSQQSAPYSREPGLTTPQIVTPHSAQLSSRQSDGLSHELKQTVSVCVRKYIPGVRRVYVSANGTLYNELTHYVMRAYPQQQLQADRAEIERTLRDHFR
ncbi:hypothetical protein [Paenibacillus sp. 481]|uniref:hypothetical protein n=1 Tax=Paenibacillus sp. 481 TaxID=2835869 RepID=UPI001E51C336|nr:hypothetical protein [Paenibacillus sp. 481]UHA75009.1 hypothetical protein KIK04_08270 [Paenibacillus sp. 481]